MAISAGVDFGGGGEASDKLSPLKGVRAKWQNNQPHPFASRRRFISGALVTQASILRTKVSVHLKARDGGACVTIKDTEVEGEYRARAINRTGREISQGGEL